MDPRLGAGMRISGGGTRMVLGGAGVSAHQYQLADQLGYGIRSLPTSLEGRSVHIVTPASTVVPSLSTGQGFFTVESLQGATGFPVAAHDFSGPTESIRSSMRLQGSGGFMMQPSIHTHIHSGGQGYPSSQTGLLQHHAYPVHAQSRFRQDLHHNRVPSSALDPDYRLDREYEQELIKRHERSRDQELIRLHERSRDQLQWRREIEVTEHRYLRERHDREHNRDYDREQDLLRKKRRERDFDDAHKYEIRYHHHGRIDKTPPRRLRHVTPPSSRHVEAIKRKPKSNRRVGGSTCCSICSVQCNTDQMLEKHIGGKRHRMQLLLLENESQEAKERARNAENESQEAKERARNAENSVKVDESEKENVKKDVDSSVSTTDRKVDDELNGSDGKTGLDHKDDIERLETVVEEREDKGNESIIETPGKIQSEGNLEGASKAEKDQSNGAVLVTSSTKTPSVISANKILKKRIRKSGTSSETLPRKKACPVTEVIDQKAKCDVCCVVVTSQRVLESHFKGKKHLARLKKLEDEKLAVAEEGKGSLGKSVSDTMEDNLKSKAPVLSS